MGDAKGTPHGELKVEMADYPEFANPGLALDQILAQIESRSISVEEAERIVAEKLRPSFLGRLGYLLFGFAAG